jgi:hypothetical protein
MEREVGSPAPQVFHSIPGSVFPLTHVLANVGEFAGGEVIPTTSGDISKEDGLALHKDEGTRVLLANLRPEPLFAFSCTVFSHRLIRLSGNTHFGLLSSYPFPRHGALLDET